MANCLLILRKQGPLPISVNFTAPSDGPAVLFVSGSAWTTTPNTSIGLQVSIDGSSVSSIGVFANQASSHQTLIPMMFPVQLSYGPHTLTLTPSAGTTTDLNDAFEVVLLY